MSADFNSEDEIQERLHDAFNEVEALSELVENSDYLYEFEPANIWQKRILASFKYCLNTLNLMSVISANENISLEENEDMKPDFLLYSMENESIGVVEVKKHISSTRQTGTEISGYAAEIRTLLPFLSEADLVSVIVSTQWPTLLRHYVAHEIIWMRRNIICLRPKMSSDGISLEVLDIDDLSPSDNPILFRPSEIAGYQLCMYDNSLYQSDNPKNRDAFDKFVPQMKSALMTIQMAGEANKSHGFAFLWKDHLDKSMAPYSIAIANVSSFHGFKKRFMDADDSGDLPDMPQWFMRLAEDVPTGHNNSIFKLSDKADEIALNFSSPRREGLVFLDVLLREMNGRAELISFSGWGYFGELFMDLLQQKYGAKEFDTPIDCPKLGREVISTLIDMGTDSEK